MKNTLGVGAALICCMVPILLIGGVFWAWPQYRVYHQRLSGEAKLKEAESSRQILVEEAKAKKESSKLLAEAEVERAKGAAEANRIIGEGLKGNHEYLMYLWIQSLGDKDNHVIYVPTEGQLPILEASRFLRPIKEMPKKD